MPRTIKLADIDATDRLRPVDPDEATFIAASIADKGLDQPIVVRPKGEGYKLTIGAHRHAAFGILGWTELEVGKDVRIRERTDLEARLDEVDENLCRNELNALDRALFLAERKKVYEEISRTLAKGGDRKSAKFKAAINSATCGFEISPRFTVDVAKRVGLSEDTIARALHIAEKLDPQAIAQLRGTRIERNQQQLLALCDEPPQNQFKIACAIKKGEAKTVTEARVACGLAKAVVADEQARLLSQLLSAWDKASKVTRASFLDAADLEPAKKRAA